MDCFPRNPPIFPVKQQVRNLWSNIGWWPLNCWSYILTELESWNMSSEELVDRRDRPWDNPDRRPSHAERRRWIAEKMLRERFSKERQSEFTDTKVQALLYELLALAAQRNMDRSRSQHYYFNLLPKVQFRWRTEFMRASATWCMG